jgi:mono/diheme cytochrome c family protein
MRDVIAAVALLAITSVAFAARLIPGDAQRGAEVFRTQNCVICHSIRGEGGTSAPDLGKIIGRQYTPSWVASIMWNHAPAMWTAIETKGVPKPQLTEGQAADLFAYFHSVRFFERPGDAGRGKRVFASKHCPGCHGISSPIPGGGPPVSSWRSLAAPIALAQQMWNHASGMQAAMAKRKFRWPELTAQELTDLLVYVQNLPETRGRVGEFALGPGPEGESLFKSKGCANCHQGKLALEHRLVGGTMADFAVDMWNHAPNMWSYGTKTGASPPKLDQDEMRQIVAYLWYIRLYAEPGSPERGRRVFAKKKCATCHNDPSSGAPDLKRVLAARTDPLRPFSMVSVLWQHGPAMLERMKQKNLAWPRFSKPEMVDLIAFLNKETAVPESESGVVGVFGTP